MTELKLMIRGVHFHVHPNYRKGQVSTDEMEQRTVARLQELDEARPEIILMLEPDNPVDPKAIRAWCEGAPIGYVAHEDLDKAHLLFEEEREMVEVQIEFVEVKKRGNFCVKAEVPETTLLKEDTAHLYNFCEQWKCDIPEFPMPDSWKACRLSEFKIDKMLSNFTDTQVEELARYVEVWHRQCLHDLSEQIIRKREHYIKALRATGNEQLGALACRLEKRRTSVCGDHRMVERMKWWEELRQSEQMERYWDKWRSSRKEDNLLKDLQVVDAHLRRLPGELYSNIGNLMYFFSILHYRDDVPRHILWKIYSLLLLRERICRELDIPMKPLSENAYGVMEGEMANHQVFPEVLCTPEARTLYSKLSQAGWLDEHWQPVGLSNAEKGTLIEYIAEELDIRAKWKFFGRLWAIDSETLRTSKTRGLEQDKTWKFRERLDAL